MSGRPELALVQRWREEADFLRRNAAPVQAEVKEACAAELETWAHERELEALSKLALGGGVLGEDALMGFGRAVALKIVHQPE